MNAVTMVGRPPDVRAPIEHLNCALADESGTYTYQGEYVGTPGFLPKLNTREKISAYIKAEVIFF